MGLTSLAKPAYKEVISEMRQLIKGGAKPLYRHSHDPGRLFDWRKFDTFATDVPKVNTGVEPIGLYFAEKMPEIHPLLNPGYAKDSLSNIRDKYLFRENVPVEPNEVVNWSRDLYKKEFSRQNKGIITGVLPPDVKNLKFNVEEWDDFLRQILGESGYPKVASRTPNLNYSSLPLDITDNKRIAVPMAKRLTKRLLDTGADAVTFPDTVADQPDIYQTVLMTHGNMLAKWRKGAETGAGVLGVAGLAAPKFFGWDSGKEME